MRRKTTRGSRSRVAALVVSITAMAALPAAMAHASTWVKGDVFAGVGGGVNVFERDGDFKESLEDGTESFTTGCAFDANDNLYSTTFDNQSVVKYAKAHPHNILDTYASQPGNNSPESIVFDRAGNFYVGHADGAGDVEKHSPSGAFLESFDVQTQNRGSDFIELATDQRTLFYTSEGSTVFRYNVDTDTQLAPFATGIGTNMFALRLLPPGDGTGGLLVANSADIKRLNASGNVVETYDAPGEDIWFALNLDPNGTSFWSGDLNTGNFYRFNIASGAIELGPVDAMPNNSLAGLCLLGEPTAAGPGDGGDGDQYAECGGRTDFNGLVFQGDDSDETIFGTNLRDALRGGAGNDTMTGAEDDDCVLGEDGEDSANGNSGDDYVDGGRGNDSVRGGDGRDDALGGPADDNVRSGRDKDNVRGQGGSDEVRGKGGKDRVGGGRGDDNMRGGGAKDRMFARGGEDKLRGGTGNDKMRGGGGNDRLNSDGGKNVVKCGTGFDVATVNRKDKVFKDCDVVKFR